ncbi:MAG TPA: trypsin-like peptidase domain-containing protein [Blastocatellia bacterium]|nr:trypsin-like peptidase domain-containing protein [Blastocatellia bacterium]
MKERTEAKSPTPAGTISLAAHRRVVMSLVALLCLSVGIAIGAVMRGASSARGEDNRLTISTGRPAIDALSSSFARVAQDVEPCVVHIKMSNGYQLDGTGSGVIVNPDGYILTNAHVVNGATRLRVKLSDLSESDAKVVGVDRPADLAVIKIDVKKTLPAARMGDSDKLAVGDWVLAIGSPFGLEQTVTAGIISAKDRDIESGSTPFQRFLQTDAAINPGNSGGPLVNLSGEVICINTQILTGTGAYTGIGFALPSSTAVDIYNQLIASGRVRRGYLGIRPQEITPQIARLNKLADSQGVVIQDTLGESSPALHAGMRSGDVIVSINNQKVKTVRELIRKIAALPVGSVANITYVRAGETRTAAVTLEERQEDGDRQEMKLTPSDPRDPSRVPGSRDRNKQPDKTKVKPTLGINVRTLTQEIAKQYGLEGTHGAFVMSVDPGSVADENGISQDDLVIEINNRPVASAEDYQRIIRDLRSGDDVVIKVLHKPQSEAIRRAWLVSLTMP